MNKKTQKKINKIVIISFLTIFMLNLIYYIFVGSKSLMNSDSNLVVDYALEAIKKGTLFPKTWNNTNDFWIYSLIPAIIPLLKLNIPLFLARQIPVFIQSSTLIIITYDLYNRILKNKLGAIIILMIILSGFSGQFMFEVYGDATYGSIIFFMVLELYLIINIYNVKNKKNFLILILLFFLILTFLTSCSLRFPIFITAPLICVIVYRYLVQKCQKKDIYIFIILILSTLIGYYLHNLLISNLLFNVGYGNPLVSSSTELQESINNVLFNILHLSGVSNLNVYSLTFKIHNNFITNDSPLVLIPFIKFLFLCLLIVIPFKIKSRIKYLNNIEEIIFVFSVSFSFILMFFLLFCGFAWWYRYITPMVFVLLLNIPIFFKLYIKDSNYIQPFIIFIIILKQNNSELILIKN